MQLPITNHLLDSLSPVARTSILSACTLKDLPVGTLLNDPEADVQYAYFLTSGIIAERVCGTEKDKKRVVPVGREGFTGNTQVMHPAAMLKVCSVQLAATGFQIRSSDLEEIYHSSEETRYRVLEFFLQEAFAFSQVANCSRLHSASSRFAHWLLMSQQRTGSLESLYSDQFLTQMLGLTFEALALILGSLQDDGVIGYSEHRLSIAKRENLQQHACECHPAAHRLCSMLYRGPWRSWMNPIVGRSGTA